MKFCRQFVDLPSVDFLLAMDFLPSMWTSCHLCRLLVWIFAIYVGFLPPKWTSCPLYGLLVICVYFLPSMWTSIAMCELLVWTFCHLCGLLASLSGLYICRHLAICGILATFVGNVDSLSHQWTCCYLWISCHL